MPAKNSRQSRRSQDFLTLKEAFGHRVLKKAWAVDYTAWCKRRDARLLPFKSRPDAATNAQVYRDAVAVEFKTEDLEPSLQSILAAKIHDRRLPFYEQDAIGNVVRGDPADLVDALAATQAAIELRRRRPVLIEANDLRKACRTPKGPERGRTGPKPKVSARVTEAMRQDLKTGRFLANDIKGWSEEAGAEQYNCGRQTFRTVREVVLSQFELATISDRK
jgi:hypothetical protein